MDNDLNNNQENTAKDNIELNRRNTMREIMNEKKAKQRLQRRGKRTHENPTQRLMNITKEEFNIGSNKVHKPPVHKNDGNQVKDGSWFDDYNNQLESVEREISLNDSKQDFYDYIGIKKKAKKQKKRQIHCRIRVFLMKPESISILTNKSHRQWIYQWRNPDTRIILMLT